MLAHGPGPVVLFLVETVGVTGVAVLVGTTPWILQRRRASEVAANEIVATSIAIALASTIAIAALHTLATNQSTPLAMAATTSLSLFLGLLVAAPPAVVLGRRTHAARPASLRRLVGISASIALFSASGLVAMSHKPDAAWAILGDYTSGWIWIALVLGILMALRVHAIASNWIVSIVATVATVAFFLGQEPSIEETLNWQVSTLGVLLVLLSSNALIGGIRRANDQRRAQQAISHIMLARTERTDDDMLPDGDEFPRALSVAAEYCGADVARLYWIDSERRRIGVAHEWPVAASGAPREEADLGPLRGLGDMRTALLQPVVFGGRVLGLALLAGRLDVPFRRLELAPLLTMIAEFYVSDLTRERALASIRNYQRRLRELAARTAQAEERVRRETAVELHDGLIQRLAVARMKLGELRHRTGDSGPIGAITKIVDESLATSRGIIHELSPSVVYELGLIPGLQKLVDDMRTEGRFRLALREHGDGCPLEESVRVGVYHVVHELVTNSIEHSGGDHVWIDVYWEQSALDAIVVSDNGRGDAWWLRETAADELSGLGLLSASERLRPIGYDIKFERRLGGGTRAIVFWSSSGNG